MMAATELFRIGSIIRTTWTPGRRYISNLCFNQGILPSLSLPSISCSRFKPVNQSYSRSYGSIYEPEYLDAQVVEIPSYDLLNIQLKGYDFPVLEKYGKYVHHTAERLGITVDAAWPHPCKKLRVTKLKPESTAVDCEYSLNIYERTVQMSDVPSTLLPVLINVVEAALPAGVTLRVHPHLPEYTEDRFVPDFELLKLKSELDDMKGDKK